jgi:hypothetical protein
MIALPQLAGRPGATLSRATHPSLIDELNMPLIKAGEQRMKKLNDGGSPVRALTQIGSHGFQFRDDEIFLLRQRGNHATDAER